MYPVSLFFPKKRSVGKVVKIPPYGGRRVLGIGFKDSERWFCLILFLNDSNPNPNETGWEGPVILPKKRTQTTQISVSRMPKFTMWIGHISYLASVDILLIKIPNKTKIRSTSSLASKNTKTNIWKISIIMKKGAND